MPPMMQVSVPINQGDNNLYLATVYYTIKKIIGMHCLVREFVTSFYLGTQQVGDRCGKKCHCRDYFVQFTNLVEKFSLYTCCS